VRVPTTPDGEVRVFIVAALRLFREGLATALARDHGFAVAGTAGSLAEALGRLPRLLPATVIVDVTLPEGTGALRHLAALPGADVVALAVPDAEADILACAEAGAAAYVTREQPIADLARAILAVARGEALCTPRVAALLLRRVAALAGERAPRPSHDRLTERELQVVALIDQGLSNKQIASALCIEVATVKNHVHNILDKLGVHRRGQAAAVVRASASGVPR
jgi:DNA-binding NarL/FixJ family response regulator